MFAADGISVQGHDATSATSGLDCLVVVLVKKRTLRVGIQV